MSIKLKRLCLAQTNHPDQVHVWMIAGRKKLTHPLQRLMGTRKCLTYSPPLLVEKKSSSVAQSHPTLCLTSNSGKLDLWDMSPAWPRPAGFSSQVLISCPSNSSLDLLARRAASSTSWDSVTLPGSPIMDTENRTFKSHRSPSSPTC